MLDARGDTDIRRHRIDDDLLIVARLGRDGFVATIGRPNVVRRCDGVVLARLVDLDRLAIEVRIGEMAGRLAEIKQGEVILLGVLVNARAAAHDLLELGHRPDRAVEHDQAAGLGVHARR